MPESWPSGVPQVFIEDNYEEQWADNLIETTMDVGPPKARPRSTSAPWFFSASMILTSTQLAAWKTFHDTTTAYRSNTVTMTQPRSSASITVRLASKPSVTKAPDAVDRYLVTQLFMVLP